MENNNMGGDSRCEKCDRSRWHRWHHGRRHAFGGGVYGLAFLGALVYYLQNAASFGSGIVGILKAIFWPAVLIYKVFGMLGM